MSVSTDRILNILEFLAADPERPRVLREFSGGLSLPPASCARILNSLARRGYAEKAGSRSGYRLGPMAYLLAGKDAYMKNVREDVAPEVEKCAETAGAHVLLGAKRGDRVYKISEFDASPEIRVRSSVLEGLYNSATGWLLLAFSGEREIERFVKYRGLPQKKEGVFFSQEEFKRELSDIRKRGHSLKQTETLAAFAFPLRFGEEYLGLGCSMLSSRFTGKKREKALAALRKTAEAIEIKLGGGVK